MCAPQAIWALGNIAADCTDLQRAVLDEEVVQPLLGCMERYMGDASLLRHCAWLLANLCRPKPQDDALLVRALPCLHVPECVHVCCLCKPVFAHVPAFVHVHKCFIGSQAPKEPLPL